MFFLAVFSTRSVLPHTVLDSGLGCQSGSEDLSKQLLFFFYVMFATFRGWYLGCCNLTMS